MKTRSADIENAIRNLNGRINDYSEENLENKFCKGWNSAWTIKDYSRSEEYGVVTISFWVGVSKWMYLMPGYGVIGTELTNVLVKETQYYYFNSVTGDLIDESVANKIKQKNKSHIQSDDDDDDYDDESVRERQRAANKASYEAYKKQTKVQNNSNEEKSKKEAESRRLANDQARSELQKAADKARQERQIEADKARQQRQMEADKARKEYLENSRKSCQQQQQNQQQQQQNQQDEQTQREEEFTLLKTIEKVKNELKEKLRFEEELAKTQKQIQEMEEKQLEDQAIQKREEKKEKFKKEAESRRKVANEAAKVEFGIDTNQIETKRVINNSEDREERKDKFKKEAESRRKAAHERAELERKEFEEQELKRKLEAEKKKAEEECITEIINEVKAIYEQGLELYETGKSKEEDEKFVLATKYYKQAVEKFKEAYDVQELDMIFESFIDVIESFIRIKAYSNALEVVQFIENNTDQKNYFEKMNILNNIKRKINDIKNNNVLLTDYLTKYKLETNQNFKNESRNY